MFFVKQGNQPVPRRKGKGKGEAAFFFIMDKSLLKKESGLSFFSQTGFMRTVTGITVHESARTPKTDFHYVSRTINLNAS